MKSLSALLRIDLEIGVVWGLELVSTLVLSRDLVRSSLVLRVGFGLLSALVCVLVVLVQTGSRQAHVSVRAFTVLKERRINARVC
jgi:hypothetical protein